MIALSYGPWMVLGSLYLHTRDVSWAALVASLVPGLLIMALAIVNAIPDFHQDRLVGKRNLVVRLGRRRAVALYRRPRRRGVRLRRRRRRRADLPGRVPGRARRASASLAERSTRGRDLRAPARVHRIGARNRRLLRRVHGPLHRRVAGRRDRVSGRAHRIDALRAPLFVCWQLTRDCDLACLHCCTDSAPGKKLADELDAAEAMRVVDEIVRNDVPYVMLCGGEPLVAPHFLAVAEALGEAGVKLKVETNGQRLDAPTIARLARLPVRSIQVSLDGDTEATYAQQRAGGSLAKAHAACRAIRAAGLPLEITFAPSRITIDEAGAVIARARSLGAFRFNTGRLMRVGTAAKLWERLEPTPEQDARFRALLARESASSHPMELCYTPYELADGLREAAAEPPATLLVLPNGWVKVAAPLPHVCADLRRNSLAAAWTAYREAWHDPAVIAAARRAIDDVATHAEANRWKVLSRVAH